MRMHLRLVLCVAAVAASAVADVTDPRVRTYVDPVRVVWQSSAASGFGERFEVKGADQLLGERRGQVPEGGWGKPASGCRLVNRGETPGILLDFGRELQGGVQLGVAAGTHGMAQAAAGTHAWVRRFDSDAALQEAFTQPYEPIDWDAKTLLLVAGVEATQNYPYDMTFAAQKAPYVVHVYRQNSMATALLWWTRAILVDKLPADADISVETSFL